MLLDENAFLDGLAGAIGEEVATLSYEDTIVERLGAIGGLRATIWLEDVTGEGYPVELLDSLVTLRDMFDTYTIKATHERGLQ